MSATVLDKKYSSGTKFHIVSCMACLSVMNSGHHYRSKALAQSEADRHNQEYHNDED